MEKKQHNNTTEGNRQLSGLPGQAPGQQVPSGTDRNTATSSAGNEQQEQHSESSLPEKENETLGTP